MFKDGSIDGLVIKPLTFFKDDRGWLSEIFREDEVAPKIMPAMSYISLTNPGMSRGPHEHTEQTDYFTFFGPGTFLFVAWDNRKGSPTYNNRSALRVGQENRCIVIVPPGLVHGYTNIGHEDGIVFNCPNKLFAGWDKKEKIDEIRHEADSSSLFILDFIKQAENARHT